MCKLSLSDCWYGGGKYFDHNNAVAWLLCKSIIMIGGFTKSDNAPITLNVLCSDTFAYASADCEPIKYSQIEDLCNKIKQYGRWGDTIWVMEQRKATPIEPVVNAMKADGVWPERL